MIHFQPLDFFFPKMGRVVMGPGGSPRMSYYPAVEDQENSSGPKVEI